MLWFDVREFGARGDGDSDDRHAIQLAINAAAQNVGPPDEDGKGAVVAFPPGVYILSGTLHIENQAGITLAGVGAAPHDDRTSSNVGPRVNLIWAPDAAPPDPAMIHFEGCSGVTIQNLSLYGRKEAGQQPGAVTLVRFVRLLGSTRMNTIRNVLFVEAELGVEMGSVEASEVLFERIGFDRVGTGFRATEESDVNYRWDNLSAGFTPRVLHLPKGGCVNVDSGNMFGCGGDGADDWILDFGNGGSSCRTSRVTALRIEGSVTHRMSKQFLRAVGDHRIALDSVCESQPQAQNQPPWMYLDGAALTCHACSFQNKPVVQWQATNRRTTVRFRDTQFEEVITGGSGGNLGQWIDDISEPDCYYSFQRCDGTWLHVPFGDLSNGAW